MGGSFGAKTHGWLLSVLCSCARASFGKWFNRKKEKKKRNAVDGMCAALVFGLQALLGGWSLPLFSERKGFQGKEKEKWKKQTVLRSSHTPACPHARAQRCISVHCGARKSIKAYQFSLYVHNLLLLAELMEAVNRVFFFSDSHFHFCLRECECVCDGARFQSRKQVNNETKLRSFASYSQ